MKAWIRTKYECDEEDIWYGEAFVVGYVAYFTIAYARNRDMFPSGTISVPHVFNHGTSWQENRHATAAL
jgi:hypothetical protein